MPFPPSDNEDMNISERSPLPYQSADETGVYEQRSSFYETGYTSREYPHEEYASYPEERLEERGQKLRPKSPMPMEQARELARKYKPWLIAGLLLCLGVACLGLLLGSALTQASNNTVSPLSPGQYWHHHRHHKMYDDDDDDGPSSFQAVPSSPRSPANPSPGGFFQQQESSIFQSGGCSQSPTSPSGAFPSR